VHQKQAPLISIEISFFSGLTSELILKNCLSASSIHHIFSCCIPSFHPFFHFLVFLLFSSLVRRRRVGAHHTMSHSFIPSILFLLCTFVFLPSFLHSIRFFISWFFPLFIFENFFFHYLKTISEQKNLQSSTFCITLTAVMERFLILSLYLLRVNKINFFLSPIFCFQNLILKLFHQSIVIHKI
jgi:hypothetical protein